MSYKSNISPEYFEDLVKEGSSHVPRDVRLQIILERTIKKIEEARKKGLTQTTLIDDDGELSPELIGLLESAIKPVRLTKDCYYTVKQMFIFDWGPIDETSKSKCILI